MKIGLDVMGGDFAPKATIGGALLALKSLSPDEKIVLIGDEKIIRSSLADAKCSEDVFEIVHAPEVIGMGEHPTKAFSQKTKSSITVGFKLLKKNMINAFASAGNSGAMLVGSVYSVAPVQGILRPCITSILPKENGGVGILLDVGINSDCRQDVLYQFAILGTLYAKYVYNIKDPQVGLLNIGEEEEKGNLLTQSAFRLMHGSTDFNFIGNVEPRDLFKEKADVIVCDGFTGNIVLKQTETIYRLMMKRNLTDEYFQRFNYENYGGTPILGVNSSVIVGHGISNDIAIRNMILLTRDVHNAKLSQKIKTAINKYIQKD
jgi:glycerol-3-phosphate acyltransferase PlsX